MIWLDRLDDAPAGAAPPLVWIVPPDAEASVSLAAPRQDLWDAARLGLDHGARRLRRLGLLRRLAARALACAPTAIRFDRDEAGGLAVVEPRPLRVGLAGRDGWSAVALATTRIGVDIEVARPAAPLPVDLLHPAEQARIAAERESDRPGAFARIWVAKEAYVKASGMSLDAALALETKVRGDRLFLNGAEILFRSRPPMLAAVVMI